MTFMNFVRILKKQIQVCLLLCVIAGSSGTHSVCICIYHQNPLLMTAAIGVKDLDTTRLMKQAVCDFENSRCMLGECKICPGLNGVKIYLESIEELQSRDTLVYTQWTSTDRSNLETHSSTVDQFIEILSFKITKLTKHHYITKSQGNYLKSLKQSLLSNEAILIGDFSENYSFVIQDAAQGFRWVNNQATIHPFILYYKEINELKHKSFCFISDHLQHCTSVVYSFQKALLPEIKSNLPNIGKIYYFSDGCAGQYKNRFNLANLTMHKQDFGIDAEWHFFATSHGKNACDGVGGVLKRAAYKASLQRTLTRHILTAKDLYEFASQNLSGIRFLFIQSSSIQETTKILLQRFEQTHTVKGTQSFHKIIPTNQFELKAFKTSQSSEFISCKLSIIEPCPVDEFQKGTYAACCYENSLWLGFITDWSSENNDYQISFLHECSRNSNRYYFPEKIDSCWVREENMLKMLSSPNIVPGIKIIYNFNRKELDLAAKMLKNIAS